MLKSGLGKKMSSISYTTRNLKVLCVLYPDPVTGYPKSFPRDTVPTITKYPNGQTLPAPKAIDFVPGTLLGSVSGELGLRKFIGKLRVLINYIFSRKIQSLKIKQFIINQTFKLFRGCGTHSSCH
jgi:hypothetical protein